MSSMGRCRILRSLYASEAWFDPAAAGRLDATRWHVFYQPVALKNRKPPLLVLWLVLYSVLLLSFYPAVERLRYYRGGPPREDLPVRPTVAGDSPGQVPSGSAHMATSFRLGWVGVVAARAGETPRGIGVVMCPAWGRIERPAFPSEKTKHEREKKRTKTVKFCLSLEFMQEEPEMFVQTSWRRCATGEGPSL
jgi:hypothetical protein